MIKLQARVRNKEIVVTKSEKTKKKIVMPFDMYQQCTKSHTDKDRLISDKDVRKIERQANHH